MARSTLELMLDSIKEREEEPPDHLPVLPQRPTSRARLPSRKRASALILSDPSCEQSNGHTGHQADALDTSTGSLSCHGNGKQHDGQAGVHKQDEVSSQAVQNGGDQMRKVSQSDQEVFRGTKEPTLLGRKAETMKASLKRRRRNHPFQSLQKGSRVWLLNQEEKWILGVTQSADDFGSVVCMAGGQFFRVSPEKLLPANPELLDGVDALEQLSYIHEPAILHNLQCRYQLGQFCSTAGSSLIAFTPPKENHHGKQSSQSSVDALKLKVKDSKQPHVNSVAHNAFEALKKDWKDQSIILSGDSGAGKTQLAKSVLQHLMSCGGNSELGSALLLIDSVLESFGNANFTSSTNASRFGKMLNINFDKAGKFCSASCQIVLFEKSRVVCQAEGECSYHIFYQLCEGADPLLREKLNLRGPMEYDYLKNSGLDGVNEASRADFRALLNSLHALGVTEKVQQEIFCLLSAILWLGNIGTDDTNISNEAADNAAKLLKCSRKDLLGAIGFGRLNPDDILAARDTLACSIYESLFYWLVAQVNKVLKSKEDCDVKSISVVDLPGFDFSKNTEGLLVNYAHEHLQQFIRWHLFQQEEEVVACGGLSSLMSTSKDENTINYLEHELIPMLIDEESGALSEGSESRFMQRLERLPAGSSCCKQLQSKELTVSHCFGEVTYNLVSFLKELKFAANPQTSQILHSCMMNLLETTRTEDNASSKKSLLQGSSFQTVNVSTGQAQVLQMMQQLDNSIPHFIFCIVPNNRQCTRSLEKDYVLQQLRISKVVEAVRFYKRGYTTNISHELFASRFGILLGPDAKSIQDALSICIAILQRLDVPSHMYKVGLTKLFFPPEQVEKLEDARKQVLQKVVGIQKNYRGYKVRSQLLGTQEKAATHLQAVVRGWLVRRGYTHHHAEKVDVERNPVYENKVETHSSTEMISSCKAISNDGESLNKKEQENPVSPGLSNKSKVEGNAEETTPADVLLLEKEEEIRLLQQSLKEYERKFLVYESKMKSKEEMLQKQSGALEQRPSGATKGSNADDLANRTAESDHSAVRSTAPFAASTRDTPETPPGEPDLTVGGGELNASRSVLENLNKELEHRTQVFNDDAKFLVEVKSGQFEANFKPDEELQKLRHRFDVWKKEYKTKLKETKGILRKLGQSDSAERSKKRWWSRN